MKMQLRSICSFCGRNIAVTKDGFIHEHGYHKQHGYKASGSCPGSWVKHLGSEAGRNWAIKRIATHIELSQSSNLDNKERAAHRYTADWLTEQTNNWESFEPVSVPAPDSTKCVHLRAVRYRNKNAGACVASAQAAQRFFPHTTANPEEVTCKGCLKRMQWDADMAAYKAYVAKVVETERCTKCGGELNEKFGEVRCNDFMNCDRKFKLEIKKPK